MRAFARLIINLALVAATAATGGWVTTTAPYASATRDVRTAMLVGVVVFFFLVACIVLGKVVPAKKKKTAQRASYSYAAPAKRR